MTSDPLSTRAAHDAQCEAEEPALPVGGCTACGCAERQAQRLLEEWAREVNEHGLWTSGHSIGAKLAEALAASDASLRAAHEERDRMTRAARLLEIQRRAETRINQGEQAIVRCRQEMQEADADNTKAGSPSTFADEVCVDCEKEKDLLSLLRGLLAELTAAEAERDRLRAALHEPAPRGSK